MPSELPTPAQLREKILEVLTPITEGALQPLDDALGGVLASDVVAEIFVPPTDNASMDGVAVVHRDLLAAAGELPLGGVVAAGAPPQALPPSSASIIYTGAVIPQGADTVIPLEEYDLGDQLMRVRDLARIKAGANIRRRGEDVRPGDVVLRRGSRLRPQDLGLCASIGLGEVALLRPVRVALLTTGNELTEPGVAPSAGALFDSNTPMVAALARSLGAEVVWRQRVRDTARETEAALESAAAAADLVVSTGGVSVGGADCVRDAVALLGEVLHWRVALKPGKPLAFGKVGTTPWLGLPGNPTSALVTFLLFAAPLIRGLQGRGEAFPQPQKIQAGFLRDGSQKREEFLRAALVDGRAELHQQQGSGVLSAAVWGDALVRVPAGHAVAYGDLVDAWTYPELLW